MNFSVSGKRAGVTNMATTSSPPSILPATTSAKSVTLSTRSIPSGMSGSSQQQKRKPSTSSTAISVSLSPSRKLRTGKVKLLPSKPPLNLNIASDHLEEATNAVIKIQRWYRRIRRQRKETETALRRLFVEKKRSLANSTANPNKLVAHEPQTRKPTNRLRSSVSNQEQSGDVKQSVRNVSEDESRTLSAVAQNSGQTHLKDENHKRSRLSHSTLLTSPDIEAPSLSDNQPSTSSRKETETPAISSSPSSSTSIDMPSADPSTTTATVRQPSVLAKVQDIMSTLRDFEKVDLHFPLSAGLETVKENKNSPSSTSARTATSSTSQPSSLSRHLRLEQLDSFLREHTRPLSATSSSRPEAQQQSETLMEEVLRMEVTQNAKRAVAEVESHVHSQKVELEERRRATEVLQKALQQQRELALRQLHDTQKEWERRVAALQQEHVATVERHYGLVDQLLEEKRALQERCDGLVSKVKEMQLKFEEKIRLQEERHSIQMKKLEAKHVAGEKLRREKWEADKTRLIKEMTVKGMETEIAQLVASHKAELRREKQFAEEQLVELEERLRLETARQLEEFRLASARDKDEKCSRERQLLQAKLDKQQEEEQQDLEAQRRRLYAEVHEERARMSHQMTQHLAENEKWRQEMEIKMHETLELCDKSHRQEVDELQRKNERDMADLRIALHNEKEAWQRERLRELEVQLAAREREIKSCLERERNQEVEAAMQALASDSSLAKEEFQKIAAARTKRMQNTYETHIADLRETERHLTEKCLLLKTKLEAVEEEKDRLYVTEEQSERILREQEKALDADLTGQQSIHVQRMEQQFSQRLIELEAENIRLKMQLSEMRARSGQEITDAPHRHS